jgi:hypothetical protein
MSKKKAVHMEFHISRQARDRYQFDALLFSISGNVIFANSHAARVFAQKVNDTRDLVSFPEQAVKAGQLNAMGMLDEILHYVVGLYRKQENAEVMRQALSWLEEKLGQEAVDSALHKFVDDFPPVAVYQRQIDPDAYLAGETAGVPNRQIALEEMLMLWLDAMNPAFSPLMELFDDSALERETPYLQIIFNLRQFFDGSCPRSCPLNLRTTRGGKKRPGTDCARSIKQLYIIRERRGSVPRVTSRHNHILARKERWWQPRGQ